MKHMVIAVSNLDRLSRGLTKAVERRAKQREEQHAQQAVQVQKVDNSVSDASATTTANTITKLSEEQYQTTIIQKILNHINHRKEETNHD